MNIVSYIFRNNPSAIAFKTKTQEYTYNHLFKLIGKNANHLRSIGVTSNSSILLYGDISVEIIVIFLSALSIGARVGFSSKHHSTNDLDTIIDQVSPTVILKNRAIIEFFNNSYQYPEKFIIEELPNDHESYFTSSSGTTGSAIKVNFITHEHLLFNAVIGTQQIISGNQHVYYGTAPLGFSYGPPSLIFSPLINGHTLVIAPWTSVKDFAENIKEFNVSVLFSSIAMYRALLSVPSLSEYTRTIKVCVAGGEYVQPELRTRWSNITGKYLTVVIGNSETSWFFAYSINGLTPIDSIGIATPGYNISTSSNQIVVTTPFGKVTETGDTGIYNNGLLTFTGRANDVIVTQGMKVMPEEIEHILSTIDGIADVQVLSLSKLGYTLIQAAVVSTSDNTDKIKQDIKAAMLLLPKHKRVKKVVFVDSVEKTFSGKPKRKETLRKLNGKV